MIARAIRCSVSCNTSGVGSKKSDWHTTGALPCNRREARVSILGEGAADEEEEIDWKAVAEVVVELGV